MEARVLIIEDNPDNLELMSYLLNMFGHATIKAQDGEEGVEAARRHKPDLILCDIQLPKMDGYGVSRVLSQDAELRKIPRVAVTALAMVGDREKVLAAGFDGYIAKPIDPENFVKQLEKFLPSRGRTPSQHQSPPAEALPQEPATGARILVVDNTAINIEVVRCTLEPFGYRVISAFTVDDAMKSALENRPDLIISDVHMPEHGGFEFILAVKATPELRDIPFVFVSASFLSGGDEARARNLGAAAYLQRPVDTGRLLAIVEAGLAQGRRK